MFRYFILTALVVFYSANIIAETVFPRVEIKVREQNINLEYADTFELRAQGLMHRKSMCTECGMLFNFKRPKMASMWMKNTLIPLDVAFIRSDGRITDIKAMQPHDLTSIGSSEKVQYAWEMNQGWFEKNNISVGDMVKLTP